MRRLPRALVSTAFVAAIALAPGLAKSLPGSPTWVPLTRNAGASLLVDASGDGSGDRDVVGSGTDAAAFVASDATHLFVRLRVNAKPTEADDTHFVSSVWGCMIDTNGVLTNYEFLAAMDGTVAQGPDNDADEVVWRWNGVMNGQADAVNETAEVIVQRFARGTYGQATLAATSTSGDADYFVDLAVPFATIRAGGNGAPAVAKGAPFRFACGASGSSTQVGGDVASPGATLSASWSDPYVCDDDGCRLDRDADGVPDAVEASLGTSPTKADTDDDGVPDNRELSPTGSVYGPYSRVDTDGDGTPDALDADSDNDCRTDLLEGLATFRDIAAPNAVASSNCAGVTPFCQTSTGSCIACDGNFGSNTSAACAFATAPACGAGALAGRCTECAPTIVGNCTTEKPACSTATGACVACTADNGAPGAVAPCPTVGKPACQPSGNLAGRCTVCSGTNTSLCTAEAPACDPLTGVCATCDGDRGGGTSRPCPGAAAPTCRLGGTGQGTCGRCTSNGDCGSGHAGPTCDTTTGACVDKDSDGDGVFDAVEVTLGTDRDKPDTDGDGIGDLAEVTPTGGGAPAKVDTDGDGRIDALDADSDDDGVPDAVEGAKDSDGDGTADFRDTDDDGDGIPTRVVILDATANKLGDDVDGDGTRNWLDLDADGDGKPNQVEGTADDDGDGIPNYLDGVAGVADAGADAAPPPDSASLRGSGLACAATASSARSAEGGLVLALAALVFVGRRLRGPGRSSARTRR